MRRIASLVAAGMVTAGSLTYALWGTDLVSLWHTLLGGKLWVLLPFLPVLALFYLGNAQRWSLMLQPFGRFSARRLLPSMMIGFAANNVLPLRLGELIRVYLLAHDEGLPRSGLLMNLALERLLDLLGILCIYIMALVLLPGAPTLFRSSAWIAAAAVAALAVVLASFALMPLTLNRLWHWVSARLPRGLRNRGSFYIQQFETALSVMRDPLSALLLIAYSIARWALAVVLIWLALHAYTDAIPVQLAMVTIGIAAFAVMLPSAPGFVGPMQAAFVFALTPLGVDREVALAASILFVVGHWLPVTAVGALYLAHRHLSFREVAFRAEADVSAAEDPS
jgi:glycosyltransferase 2 family protein